MRYTIKDIANEAHVSVSTVSKCLNGYSDIGKKTKELVLSTIEKMDYVPNTYARYVSHQSTKVIGLTVPDVKDPYSAQCTYGIEKELVASGYDLFIGNVDRSEERFISFLHKARTLRFDGLILTPENWSDKMLKSVAHMDVPVLSIRRRPPEGSSIPYIDSDHRTGALKIMSYLHSKGHTRIAHVKLPTEAGDIRSQAYIDYCNEHGLSKFVVANESSASILNDAIFYGRECTRQIMREFPQATAIFCGSDFIAVGVYEYLREIGKRIPEDISIVSIGNVEISEIAFFKLTTLELHRYEMGVKAAQLMLKQIKGQEIQNTLFPSSIVERNSVMKIN